MLSGHSRLGGAVAPTLSGLSLAACIAREAVDAVPIVKEALGVIARILALAEKIDGDREALHALAHRSAQLAVRVKDVLGDEEPDPKLLPSLERMYSAFHDVEVFMTKHLARNRLTRGLSYAFTLSHHVDRLSRRMEDALQEIFTVTLLAIDQDAQYDGEFRLIRHCQVEKLDMLSEDRDEQADGNLLVKYHTARVDGQLLVVRFCESTKPQDAHAVTAYSRLAAYDFVLKELSTVQRSHPNVARIYGWSKGSMHSRFTVFQAGFHPLESLIDRFQDLVTVGIHWALDVLDAVHHLEQMGISWKPNDPPYALTDRLVPTIGLRNDLQRVDPDPNPLVRRYNQVFWATLPLWYYTPPQEAAAADIQAAILGCQQERFVTLLGRFETIWRRRYVIRRAAFLHRRILCDGTAEGLLTPFTESKVNANWRAESWTWANIFRALDITCNHSVKNGLHVHYTTNQRKRDVLEVHGLDEYTKVIVYDYYQIPIPDVQRDEVREMLGIPPLSEDEDYAFHFVGAAGPGTYLAPN